MIINRDVIKIHHQKEVADFAAQELTKFLELMFTSKKTDDATPGKILYAYIGKPEWCQSLTGVKIDETAFSFDGFYLGIDGATIIISSLFARGMLYGVYELLNKAGCRWYYPGKDGEFIPKADKIDVEDGEWYLNPEFEIRGFADGTHKKPVDAWIDEMFEAIDWMGKNKCNSIFIYNNPDESAQSWDMLLPEMKKRDMIIEIGGHGVQNFMPSDLFETKMPDGSMPNNVYGFYAPRERCYSHGIGDTNCARNVVYHDKLIDVVETFGKNTYIFEYYNDLILYQKMKTNMSETIKDDMIAYKAAGVNKITSLMFGRYSWLAYEFNMLAFARLAWDTGYDHNDLLKEMCAVLYPVNSDALHDFYQKLEMASYYMFTFDGYRGDVNDIRNLKIRPLEYFGKHVENILKSHELFIGCAEIIAESLRNPDIDENEKRRLKLQDLITDISVKESLAVYFQMKARMLKAQCHQDIPELEGMMDEAMEIEQKMEEWIKMVPLEIKGIAGGEAIFEKHLCNDMFQIYRNMKRRLIITREGRKQK